MKVWFDISGIYNWQGNFTGIQRIVYNLGKEFYKDSQDTGFFIYKHNKFVEVSFDMLESRLKTAQENNTSMPEKTVSLPAVQHHLVLNAKAMVRGTPLEPFSRTVYSSARSIYRKSKAHWREPHAEIFNSKDVVIVIDGNWQFPGYADAIITAKSHRKFYLVHFVNDLVALKNPAYVNRGAEKIIGGYFNKLLQVADRLIAISDNTKKDIEWYLKKIGSSNTPDIEVLKLGSESMSKRSQKPPGINQPFILSVSTIEVRKNHISLYYAYKLAAEKGIELPNIVIIGRKGWMAEEAYALLTKDPAINQKILILNNISDQELEWLYQNCLFTVFPSFYEGWGLPIAESLAHGKCCISSNTSSMPEVGGDLANYVSPYDTSELLGEMSNLMDRNTRKQLEKKIVAGYRTVSWHEVFTELKNIISYI